MQRHRSDGVAFGTLILVAALTGAGNLAADTIGDSRSILCTVLDAYVCIEAGGCAGVEAEELNVPRFIQIDTGSKKLFTTAASGENRETVADSLKRSDGQIILQGLEGGRAFSAVIVESTGFATFAAATDGRSLSTFGVCTPLPIK